MEKCVYNTCSTQVAQVAQSIKLRNRSVLLQVSNYARKLVYNIMLFESVLL